MESNKKRRGFFKTKLASLPFYKTRKAAQFNNKTTSDQQHVSNLSSKVGFVVHQNASKAPVVRNKTRDPYAQSDHKVFAYPDDEGIDLKAANYISSVLERFKLEQ